MNLVSLLIAPAIVSQSLHNHTAARVAIALVALVIVVVAVVVSKRRPIAVGEEAPAAAA